METKQKKTKKQPKWVKKVTKRPTTLPKVTVRKRAAKRPEQRQEFSFEKGLGKKGGLKNSYFERDVSGGQKEECTVSESGMEEGGSEKQKEGAGREVFGNLKDEETQILQRKKKFSEQDEEETESWDFEN